MPGPVFHQGVEAQFEEVLASVLDRAQVPIGSIQRILGHENRTTTEIYLHSIGEAEGEAMAVFERACQETPLEKSHTQIHTQ